MKFLKYSLIILFLTAAFFYFIIKKDKKEEKVEWGVNFSQKQAEGLGLDWKELFSALLDDLKVKRMRISVHWNLIEKEQGKYYFDDLDWQLKESQKRKTEIILAIGKKTPRWPECHEPEWVKGLSEREQNQALLGYLKELIERYRDYDNIWAWQIENEPFFPFGQCPEIKEETIKEEIKLVKFLDLYNRPVVISDSGEGSLWLKTAKIADILGVTVYRKLWSNNIKMYFKYPFPPVFYRAKGRLVKAIFNKEIINVELQAEPWGPDSIQNIGFKEQEKSMSLKLFKENVAFAKKTGFVQSYFWGTEWWYWLKVKHSDDKIWNEAKKLFQD